MWTKSNIPDQTGKTIIVTGANTGIGYETALALYEAGAHVVLACRSMDKAKDA
jgi:NAD(P)-dependent dehydrogenase (short-subunit alcohol dehydrogenase family)